MNLILLLAIVLPVVGVWSFFKVERQTVKDTRSFRVGTDLHRFVR
jgi:hypothetical protein